MINLGAAFYGRLNAEFISTVAPHLRRFSDRNFNLLAEDILRELCAH